jgi:2-polyprenyl-6-methoxyphenol hydroxylase-like FAD-dependent oxidoreductase
LLVAADGARSKLRQEAGIAAAEFAYGQTGIVATVAHELPHGGVAHEHFLPSGPFAMLPMTDYEGRHRSSIVWTERRELAPSLLAYRTRNSPRRSSGASAEPRPDRNRGHAGPIRCASSMRPATPTTGWCWWAMPPCHPSIAGQG